MRMTRRPNREFFLDEGIDDEPTDVGEDTERAQFREVEKESTDSLYEMVLFPTIVASRETARRYVG